MSEASDKVDPKDEILEEARKRFEMAESAHSENRQSYREAIQFVSGEQWDLKLKQAREGQGRPCLVLDRITTHINRIVNEQRKNKPQVKVHPVDDQGDIRVAEIYDGCIRHIERVSNATTAYETAGWTQVAGGQGYWRVLTEYVDESAFDQDIRIERITNPLTVFVDPEAKEQEGSDAEWMFVITEMARKTFEKTYPDANPSNWAGQSDTKGWYGDDSVRIAEYWRITHIPVELAMTADGAVMDADEVPEGMQVIATRKGSKRKVEWFKIGGMEVLDQREWPGKWIPIIRIVGNELDQDGTITYTGLTDRLMDAQRAYNYWNSVVTETVALQPKAPYIGAKGQFKGVESRWADANTSNPPYLEYEPLEVNGTIAPPPMRQPPPTVPAGALQALNLAAQDMQWISGQMAVNFGAPSQESSGKAILAKQQEGDTATYHYLDNLARGIRHTGRILVDLIPRVYDTARVIRILGDDGTANPAAIDPSMPGPYAELQGPNGDIQKIYNLDAGRYDVEIIVGPSFATKRLEAVDAMTALLQAAPNLWQVVGDLYLRNQDWPGSQAMADRIKKTIPPQLVQGEDGNNTDAMVGQMQAALAQAQQMLQQREMQMQQAMQLAQQADGEIQQLQQEVAQQKQEIAARDTDLQAKVANEQIKAGAIQYRADADVRISELEAMQKAAEAQEANEAQEIAQIRQGMDSLQQAIVALSQREQPVVVDTAPIAAAVMAAQCAPKPPVNISFVRQNGQLVGAQIVPQG